MFTNAKAQRRLATLVLGAGLAVAPVWAWAAEPSDYEKLLTEKAPALVTVKFVLKVKMGGMMSSMGEQENESEISGVMIDPKGLVLCSNTELGGFTAMMKRLMGTFGGNLSATPTDLKVLVGDDTEGREAKLIARDTELDLAWIQIKQPGEKPFAYVDFTKAVTPKIGDRLLAVRRMGKFFDRIATVVEGRLGGITTKPRKLYVPATPLVVGLGLPIFASNGQALGVAILQMPDEEYASSNPMAMFGRLSSIQDMMGGLILPADEVVRATKRAKQIAAAQETDTSEEAE